MDSSGSTPTTPGRGARQRLTPDALAAGLSTLPGWALDGDALRLRRTLRFKDFVEAMAFVDAMAVVAERQGHHPDFAVHWNTVDVTLWTHDAGGLTQKDLALAGLLGGLREARGAEG